MLMNNLLWNLLGNREKTWRNMATRRKQRKERISSNVVTTFISSPCPLFMRPPSLSQIARFLSFSLLPPVKYNAHCALLDKCNFCDEKPLNVTNMSNDALKYHNMNYLSSVSFPRLSDLCLFPPSPVEQPTLQWYALSLKCYLCNNIITNVTNSKNHLKKHRIKDQAWHIFMYCALNCCTMK